MIFDGFLYRPVYLWYTAAHLGKVRLLVRSYTRRNYMSLEDIAVAKGSIGKVVQVQGAVVDVEFPSAKMPNIYHAIEICHEDGKAPLVLEVQQHLGNDQARCIAMGPTDGLRRGIDATDTGGPISVPVGPATLGRVFNVLGRPIDGLGEFEADAYHPIHRPAPLFKEQTTKT